MTGTLKSKSFLSLFFILAVSPPRLPQRLRSSRAKMAESSMDKFCGSTFWVSKVLIIDCVGLKRLCCLPISELNFSCYKNRGVSWMKLGYEAPVSLRLVYNKDVWSFFLRWGLSLSVDFFCFRTRRCRGTQMIQTLQNASRRQCWFGFLVFSCGRFRV